jgi:hypothetical protein
MLTELRTTSENPDFINLVQLLDADLKIRDGEEHEFYAQINKTAILKNVIVCYENEIVVGCGAFRDKANVCTSRISRKKNCFKNTFRTRGLGFGIKLHPNHSRNRN